MPLRGRIFFGVPVQRRVLRNKGQRRAENSMTEWGLCQGQTCQETRDDKVVGHGRPTEDRECEEVRKV